MVFQEDEVRKTRNYFLISSLALGLIMVGCAKKKELLGNFKNMAGIG